MTAHCMPAPLLNALYISLIHSLSNPLKDYLNDKVKKTEAEGWVGGGVVKCLTRVVWSGKLSGELLIKPEVVVCLHPEIPIPDKCYWEPPIKKQLL